MSKSNTPDVDYIANGLGVLFHAGWTVVCAVVGFAWGLVSLIVKELAPQRSDADDSK